jgi:hypothetical protein
VPELAILAQSSVERGGARNTVRALRSRSDIDRAKLKAASNVRASACSARHLEGFLVRSHKFLHGHRRLAGQLGDEFVFTREEAVLIV